MKRKHYYLTIIVLFLTSCSDADSSQKQADEPMSIACLQSYVNSALSLEVQNPKAQITQGTLNGERVFIVETQNFPDGQSFLLNADCSSICTSGGLVGETCDVMEQVDQRLVIWTDPR
jgi:hypothetical protein